MIDVNVMVLENGIEYTEIDSLIYNNKKYVLLTNIKDVKDSCIRRIEIEDNEEYIYRLDDDDEFDLILSMFVKKNEALFV